MAILVILVLGALWAAVLLPPILRSRNASGMGGVSDFMDGLRSLGRGGQRQHNDFGGTMLHGPVGAPPRPPVASRQNPIAPPMAYRPMPGGISPMQRRRRNVLFVLGGAVAFTFLIVFMMGSMMFWLLFLLSAGALGGYVFLLVQFKQQAATKYTAPKRVYATPIAKDEESPKVGDNVILLRRSVG